MSLYIYINILVFLRTFIYICLFLLFFIIYQYIVHWDKKILSDAVAGDPLADLVQRAFNLDRQVELHGRVLDGERVLAEFRIPATTGRRATLWSGFTGSHLADWDTDVANQAAAATPDLAPFFDGITVNFMVAELSPQRCEVQVGGTLQPLRSLPTTTPLAAPFTPEFEPIIDQCVELEERAIVPLVDGRGRVRLGGSPLALELEVAMAPHREEAARATATPAAPSPPSFTRWYPLPLVASSAGQRRGFPD